MNKHVMQQALEALVYHREQTRAITQSDTAIAALKEAIKQPTELDEAIAAGDGALHGAITYWQNRALKAEAVKQTGEPVAYRITTPDGITWIGAHPSILPKHTSEPLFTAAPSIPEGMRLVPIEPTEAMLDAIAGTRWAELGPSKQSAEVAAYNQMLSAAPSE